MTDEADSDAVIFDPIALPPQHHSTSSAQTSPPNQAVINDLIRNQVVGLLNILIATKENSVPDVHNLIPILQKAIVALKGQPTPVQPQLPRGNRGGQRRRKKIASRTSRMTLLPSHPPSPAPKPLNANAPSWPRGQSLSQQAPSQQQHFRGTQGGRRKHEASRPEPMSSSSQETPNEGTNVSRTTRKRTNNIPSSHPLRAPKVLSAKAPSWPRGQPQPAPHPRRVPSAPDSASKPEQRAPSSTSSRHRS
jgi:hypothetical protein